jgi:hypothetical protein
MWPIHGEYQYRTCGHRQPVVWEQLGHAPNATKAVTACLTEVVSGKILNVVMAPDNPSRIVEA